MQENNTKKYTIALLSITIIGFILRLTMAHLDPFLHDWDERYHALVARNMMDNPLVPMLRKVPLLPVNHADWTNNHIWLHKQPLFLWQIALSLKLFGVNEFAVRYPSVLMGTLMIPMLYYIAKYFTQNKTIALITAALFSISCFQLDLTGGLKGMDHNDVGLGFYILASVFAWIKYLDTRKWYWALLAGLFSGCAILVKWLYGLYVFLLWGIYILAKFKSQFRLKEIMLFLLALVVCCVVFLPWQFYISHVFPVEAQHEYEFNRRHITEALESHVGGPWFYVGRFPILIGEAVWLLFFPGLYLFFKLKENRNDLFWPIFGGIAFLFVFLSFGVTTKVISHFYFVVPFMFIFIAITLFVIFKKINRQWLNIIIGVIVGILILKPEKAMQHLSAKNEERNLKVEQAGHIKKLPLPEEKLIGIFGAEDYVEIMFYHDNVIAYPNVDIPIELREKRQLKLFFFNELFVPKNERRLLLE